MKKIVRTGDGSDTIFVTELNEHYHSVHGAIRESTCVYIINGFDFCNADPVRILEIGFGTGLNAMLTFMKAAESGRYVEYTSIEKFPLSPLIINSLNYIDFFENEHGKIFDTLHSLPWDRNYYITDSFIFRKIKSDFTVYNPSGSYDLIYYDAFGPDKQPEMWTKEVMIKIAGVSAPGAVFVTYSAKGEVKRNLNDTGFSVSLLPGPPGKRHVIRAVKI